MTVSPSQLAINQLSKPAGVSFTKNKLIKQEDAKNMDIHDSMGKKTIGLSSKLKLGSTNESNLTTKHQPTSSLGTGTINNRIISNYVSKTAQASSYASKNNSNNSSMARGDSLNPVMQHKTLGSRLNAVLKKKKPNEVASDQDQSSLV